MMTLGRREGNEQGIGFIQEKMSERSQQQERMESVRLRRLILKTIKDILYKKEERMKGEGIEIFEREKGEKEPS